MKFNRILHLERCRKKRDFESQEDAESFVKLMKSSGFQRMANFVYKCPMCSSFHTSSTEPDEEENARIEHQELMYQKGRRI